MVESKMTSHRHVGWLIILLALLSVFVLPNRGRTEQRIPTAYVLIDNEREDLVQTILNRIRLSLSLESSQRLASQGQFDASPRLFVRFRGDCRTGTTFVREVAAAVREVGDMPTSCRANLP